MECMALDASGYFAGLPRRRRGGHASNLWHAAETIVDAGLVGQSGTPFRNSDALRRKRRWHQLAQQALLWDYYVVESRIRPKQLCKAMPPQRQINLSLAAACAECMCDMCRPWYLSPFTLRIPRPRCCWTFAGPSQMARRKAPRSAGSCRSWATSTPKAPSARECRRIATSSWTTNTSYVRWKGEGALSTGSLARRVSLACMLSDLAAEGESTPLNAGAQPRQMARPLVVSPRLPTYDFCFVCVSVSRVRLGSQRWVRRERLASMELRGRLLCQRGGEFQA